MEVLIRYPYGGSHYDEDFFMRVSSVGVWLLVDNTYFLFTQQADQPGNPWGIPAGKVELEDASPKAAAIREVKEETGIDLQENDLTYLTFLAKRAQPNAVGSLIYLAKINSQGHLNIEASTQLENGTKILLPPASVNSAEIMALSLIPKEMMFTQNLFQSGMYHTEATNCGLFALRNRGIITGRFNCKDDPYL